MRVKTSNDFVKFYKDYVKINKNIDKSKEAMFTSGAATNL